MRSSTGWKLAAVILAVGLTACALLAFRQGRLQAAHELARAQERLRRHEDRVLWLRGQVLTEFEAAIDEGVAEPVEEPEEQRAAADVP